MRNKKNIKSMVRRGIFIALASLFTLQGCTDHEVVYDVLKSADPVFRTYCLTAVDMDGNLRIDLDGDGKVTKKEAAQVEEISLDNEGADKGVGVQSLAGIEYFTGLRKLNLGTNYVQKLNLSSNTKLVYLNCADNRLASLDLSANVLLETLNCSQNSISALDVSMLSSLKSLACADNLISRLDIGNNSVLTELICDLNRLRTLDVGGCSALTDLTCAGNGLTSLTLPRASVLERLNCGANEQGVNELKTLDLSGQGKLSLLRVNVNPLSSLNTSECVALRTLECVSCKLTSLDITANTRLRMLFCNRNPEGMKIYVPAGFNPSKLIDYDIGTAEFVERN